VAVLCILNVWRHYHVKVKTNRKWSGNRWLLIEMDARSQQCNRCITCDADTANSPLAPHRQCTVMANTISSTYIFDLVMWILAQSGPQFGVVMPKTSSIYAGNFMKTALMVSLTIAVCQRNKLTNQWFCSTKVLCPQNLFSRKSQSYKGRMPRYVDIQHLYFWHWHILGLLLTKSRYSAMM